MGKADYMLILWVRSCLLCTEPMSGMDTVVHACIVCSGMENKGVVIVADFVAPKTTWVGGIIHHLPTVVYLIHPLM